MTGCDHVIVAVPACDEERLIGACLEALHRAADLLRELRPMTVVEIVVALDACVDDTASVVAAHDARTVVTSARMVGVARDAAIHAGLANPLRGGLSPDSIWVACTDADTLVPPHWLLAQLELAAGGADLVVGTVEPTGDLDPLALAMWRERHRLAEGHDHVHGANLGVRASAYLAAGGFGAIGLHEDVALAERVRSGGWTCRATDTTRVLTAARTDNRVPGGFAGYLRELGTADAG